VRNGEDGAPSAPQIDVPLPFLRADIRVDIPRNAWIHGPGTAIEISGDLQLTKALQQPFILSGGMTMVRGFATVYGKKFAVKEGQVTSYWLAGDQSLREYNDHAHGLELPGDK
jgi:hypothetical protein